MNLEKGALVLIDYQKDYLHPEGFFQRAGVCTLETRAREELLGKAALLVQAFKQEGKPVVWVNTELRKDHIDSALPLKFSELMATNADGDFLVEGTWGAEVMDEVKPSHEDYVVIKKGNGAFQFTVLDRLLVNLGVSTCVVLGGGLSDSTDALADSVRRGAALGYEMIIAGDAIYPPQSFGVELLAQRRAMVFSSEEIVAALSLDADVPATEPPPVKTAMLIIDLQNDFVHPQGFNGRMGYSTLTEEDLGMLIENNQHLLRAVRQKGLPVVFARVINRKDMLDKASPIMESDPKPIPAEEDDLIEGTWGAQIIDGLDVHEEDLIVTKKGRSAFFGTNLHRTLRNLKVTRCITTGGAAHGCMEDTVREGAGLGYAFTIVPDAAYKPNTPTIGVMSNYADFKTTKEVLAELGEA